MKKISQLIVLILVVTSLPLLSVASQENGKSITGNRNVIIQDRTIESFHSLNVRGGIDVELSQGSNLKLQVEADENIISSIRTEVKDGVLSIYPDKSVRNAKTMKIHLTFQNLSSITALGGCDINSTKRLDFSTLETELSGGCDINLDLNVQTLICNLNGGCDARFAGDAENCTFNVIGGSDLKAPDLNIINCNIEAIGGSDVTVKVSGELTMSAVGASDITYSGSPVSVTKNTSGASDIHRK